MMFYSTKKWSAVVCAMFGCSFLASSATAFQIQNAKHHPIHSRVVSREVMSPMYAASTDNDENQQEISRRDVMVQTTLAAAAAGLSMASSANAAEEGAAGRLIELAVENLDGEAGKSGKIVIQLRPDWAPKGAARFEELTEKKFWDGCRIFRVLPGFVSQFGINGDPTTQSYWRSKNLQDDPVKVSNTRGTVVFATAGPNTRTTQIFINTGDRNSFLDRQGFSPFGEVVEGMDIVDRLYSGYGEGAPSGKGPNQGLIQLRGNEYLEDKFPKLSYFSTATFK